VYGAAYKATVLKNAWREICPTGFEYRSHEDPWLSGCMEVTRTKNEQGIAKMTTTKRVKHARRVSIGAATFWICRNVSSTENERRKHDRRKIGRK